MIYSLDLLVFFRITYHIFFFCLINVGFIIARRYYSCRLLGACQVVAAAFFFCPCPCMKGTQAAIPEDCTCHFATFPNCKTIFTTQPIYLTLNPWAFESFRVAATPKRHYFGTCPACLPILLDAKSGTKKRFGGRDYGSSFSSTQGTGSGHKRLIYRAGEYVRFVLPPPFFRGSEGIH